MFVEATSAIASRITGVIQDAARATGASFDYLLKTAQRESSLNPQAKAATSSATGLFQFIDQTWLGTLKEAGPQLGLQRYADGIERTPSGRYVVADPTRRQEIMQLRTDPVAATLVAGAFTSRNTEILTDNLGRPPTDGELYIAHFLGSAGAVKLISAAATGPDASAADLFPSAAQANRPIFYDRQGSARSVAQVYDVLVKQHDGAGTPTTVAGRTGRTAVPVAIAAQDERLPARSAYAAETGPIFHGLFRSGAGEPVSAVVSALWGPKSADSRSSAATRVAAAAPVTASASAPAGEPLKLFQFLRPEIQTSGRV